MKLERALEFQAHADGELDAGRQAEVERWLKDDPEAAAVRAEVFAIRQAVREHEPAGTVPDTRDFYWSQIQRRIAAEGHSKARLVKPGGGWMTWVRWLAPALGVAAVALVVTLRSGTPTRLADASVMTFRSESDGLTIHWLN